MAAEMVGGGEAVLGSHEETDKGLRRSMTKTQLLLLGVGAQIGSGWLFAVLAAAGVAGPAAILSWIIAAVLFGFISLAWMELGAMLPRSGALVRYPHLTHGAFTGWVMGWVYWLSVVTIPALEAEAVLTYLGGRFPATGFITTSSGVTLLVWPDGILAGIGLMLLFLVLNLAGIRALAEANRWVTLWKLIIPTLTFCFLFAILDGTNFTGYGGFTPLGLPGVFQAIATSGIAFSYLGFRQALDFGGEVRNPQRAIPFATIGSIVIPMIVYTLLQAAFLGSINWGSAGLHPGQWADLVSSKWASGPFFHALAAASIAALAAFGNVLLADAAISPTGTGWIYLGTTTRIGYGLSIHRYVPKVFRRISKVGIPWPAAVAAFVVGCVFFVPAPSWYRLVSFVSAAAVLTYIMGGAGLTVLRRTAPELSRPFRLGASFAWAPIGYVASMLIVYWSGYTTLVNLLAVMFIGFPVYGAYAAVKRGWVRPVAGWTISAVFLGAWIYLNDEGGWILSAAGGQRPGSWGFGLYDGVFSATVAFFCLGMWLASNPEGRRHVARTAWLMFLLLATFPLSFYGGFGPLKTSPLPFPYGSLIEIGLAGATYYWAVASGFATDEIGDIVAAEAARPGQGGPSSGRGGPAPADGPAPAGGHPPA
ncbi:MAG: APC family permease [Acidimicrobiales bacterium]